jgi:hypothetical protein
MFIAASTCGDRLSFGGLPIALRANVRAARRIIDRARGLLAGTHIAARLRDEMTRTQSGGRRTCGAGSKGRPCALAVSLILAAASMAERAEATETAGPLRLGIDWSKLGALLRPDDTPLLPPATWWAEAGSRLEPTTSPSDTPLLGPPKGSTRLALVARDWSAARLLMGRLSPADQVRLGRSRRMVLLRARLAEGTVVPVLDVGLGQWRVDPDMPVIPHDVELAGQVGAGLELGVASHVQMVFEATCTVLYPDPEEARWTRRQDLWGGFVATRFTF